MPIAAKEGDGPAGDFAFGARDECYSADPKAFPDGCLYDFGSTGSKSPGK